MSTLYEITGQYLELYEMMESADELEMKVIEDTLDGMDGELEEKAENYAIIMAELDAEAAKFEKEADRLAARAEQLHGRGATLKDRLIRYFSRIAFATGRSLKQTSTRLQSAKTAASLRWKWMIRQSQTIT